jgi:molybdopterin converting factor small subunit
MRVSSQPTVTVRVLLFARYAELLGGGEMEVEVAAPATIASVLSVLRARAGAARLPEHPLVARNQVHATLGTALEHGDEVAVLPPLAGG